MSPAPLQPPRLASWLVDLLVSGERAESIAGDLLEEFYELASQSGIASARSWYWRQSLRTIAHLIGTSFRAAPWVTLGAAVAGLLLLRLGILLPGRAMGALFEFRWHHVVPYYTQAQVNAYLFWFNTGSLIGRILIVLFVGCIVAIISLGNEMAATVNLSLLLVVQNGTSLVLEGRWPPSLIPLVGYPIMIVMCGVIVRGYRSAWSHRLARA